MAYSTSDKLTATADLKKNRLYITVTGTVTKKDLDMFYTDIRFCVADLQEGFDVIAIYSDCKIAHLSALPTFRRIMNYLITNGVHEVIRVMPEKCVFTKQVLNFTARIQGYKPLCVSTLKAAEERLESMCKREGIRFQLNHFPVEYEYHGVSQMAYLQDISLSGCAVSVPDTEGLSSGMEIVLKICFDRPDGEKDTFVFNATVVRVDSRLFAVTFNGLDSDQQQQLFTCLARECQKEVL